MHRVMINEAFINLVIKPDGPILIKAGEALAGIRPDLPDMAFVRTHFNGVQTVYIPGSSLKGVIRSHCERIARTLDPGRNPPLSCDPLAGDHKSCSKNLEKTKEAPAVYARSCFVCKLFGNTSLASHIHFADALPRVWPDDPDQTQRNLEALNATEERNGVAIDRIFGSVAQGPFQFEVVVQGEFATTITLRNFSCAHLGLLALALRDLNDQRIMLGFGKSRGLGRVRCEIPQVRFRRLWAPEDLASDELLGFLDRTVGEPYGWSFHMGEDRMKLPVPFQPDGWGVEEAVVPAERLATDPQSDLWPVAVQQWAKLVASQEGA